MRARKILNLVAIASALCVGACVAANEDEAISGGPTVTFSEYLTSLPRNEAGEYIVEGDIGVSDPAELTDYYAATFLDSALILDLEGTVDNKYTAAQALELRYCVSTAFGAARHDQVRDAFASAATEWMNATTIAAGEAPTIKFTYLPAQDGNCASPNAADRLFFYIQPDAGVGFDADAFKPNEARAARVLRITNEAFTPVGAQTLTSTMRHEIGHILGFRHEHIATLSCNGEEPEYRALTTYDVPSVMHYRQSPAPKCRDAGTTQYQLTTHDSAGVRCVYTTQARVANDLAGDACRALTSLSSAAPSFVISGNGQVYRMLQSTATNGVVTTTIARYVPPTTTAAQRWADMWTGAEPAGEATTGIFAGGIYLYRRTLTGIHRWGINAWVPLAGDAGSSVAVAYDTGDLFRLNVASALVPAGSIDRFIAGSNNATHILNTGAAGRKLFVGTSELFRLESNGVLWMWTTAGWSAAAIGSGIKAVAKTRDGRIFSLLTGAAGTVMLRGANNAWSVIGSGASAIWGGLEVPYMSLTNGITISRNTSGSTWRRYALSSKSIMMGANTRIVINVNNRPYFYATP